jgi:hypothetical protein
VLAQFLGAYINTIAKTFPGAPLTAFAFPGPASIVALGQFAIAALERMFMLLFVSTLSVWALFEGLGVLFDFPSPIYAVATFTNEVVSEFMYWLPFRLFTRGRGSEEALQRG